MAEVAQDFVNLYTNSRDSRKEMPHRLPTSNYQAVKKWSLIKRVPRKNAVQQKEIMTNIILLKQKILRKVKVKGKEYPKNYWIHVKRLAEEPCHLILREVKSNLEGR